MPLAPFHIFQYNRLIISWVTFSHINYNLHSSSHSSSQDFDCNTLSNITLSNQNLNSLNHNFTNNFPSSDYDFNSPYQTVTTILHFQDPQSKVLAFLCLLFVDLTNLWSPSLGRSQAFSPHHNEYRACGGHALCTCRPDIPVTRTAPWPSPDAPVYPSVHVWPPLSPLAQHGLCSHHRLYHTI